MITRIYVDNFRTLVNFEWKPGRVALLMGANGSGKTSLLHALAGVRQLVKFKHEVKDCFAGTSRARWETRNKLTIEIDVTLAEHAYSYKLLIEHDATSGDSRVVRETLHQSERALMEFADGELQMFNDDGSPGPRVAGDTTRVGLGAIASKQNRHLTVFKEWLSNEVFVFEPDPRGMSGRTDGVSTGLRGTLSNFASWLPVEMTRNFKGVLAATEALREVLDGFDSIQVSRTSPLLEAVFRDDSGSEYTVGFDELSDGQRQLCALYFVRHARMLPGRLIVFDEPDNYVSLREIQPWLNEMLELALQKDGPQVWFISHHPELINQLAPGRGVRFFRRGGGPTRIEPFSGAEGLTAAEAVARGWDGE